jgi:hypothetical protein
MPSSRRTGQKRKPNRTKVAVQNDSQDSRYFTLTPRLIWALSRDPYDYIFWSIIKDIAGEEGECFLSTDQLSDLTMMSTGKISSCRKYWMAQGVFSGALRRDAGYPQPVYHLRVKNIWKANVDWCETYASIQSRIDFKHAQAESLHQVKAIKKSLHVVKPSPGEEGISPHEEGVSPSETKNNRKKIQKNTRERADKPRRRTSAKKTRKTLSDHPAIQVYHEIMKIVPNDVQHQMIVERVGNNGHVDDWRATLVDWKAHKWKPQNVPGMLEKFEARIGAQHATTQSAAQTTEPSAEQRAAAERINAARAAKQQRD